MSLILIKVADITKKKFIKWGIVFLVTLFSIFILYLNHLMPLVLGDDLLYKMKFPSEGFIGTDKINTLAGYFESQINHYLNYNNRIAPHALLQLVFLFGPWLFDVLNTLVFLFLPWLMIRPFVQRTNQAKVDSNNTLILYLTVLLLIWCFHYDLGRSYFWTTGSVNYTWFLVLQVYYIGRLYGCFTSKSKLNYIDLIVVSLIATSNENVVLTLFFLTLFVVLKTRQNHERLDHKMLLGCVILFVGGLMMLLAPSLHTKVQTEYLGFDSWGNKVTEYLFRAGYYLLSSLPLFLVFIIFRFKNNVNKGFFFLTILIGTLVMILAPLYEPRSSIFVFIMIGMLLISLVDHYNIINKWPIAILILVSMGLFFTRHAEFKAYNVRYLANSLVINSSINHSKLSLPNYCYRITSKALVCDDISTNPNALENKIASNYYNIDTIVLDTKLHDGIKNIFTTRCNNGVTDWGKSYHSARVISNSSEIGNIWFSEKELLIALNDKSEDVSYILRGSKRSHIKHQIFKILPLSLRLYFLDFLETVKPEIIECQGLNVTYDYIDDLQDYEYLLWSKYSKNNHKAVGEIVEIRFQ